MPQKPRILMFGWEFPPVISGGLGVACLGLCKALSEFTELKMIIPKSAPGFQLPNMELIGLNSFNREQLLELYRQPLASIQTYDNNNTDFNPYQRFAQNEFIGQKFYEVYSNEVQPFELDQLYSSDVIKKVIEYSRICTLYGLRQNFDIIHAHDWMTFLPAMELKKQSGKPLVLHVHSLEYDRGGENSRNWVWELERKAMEMADFVLPVSRYTGSIISQFYGIDSRKIQAVHNGVEPIERSNFQNLTGKKLIIFFGRITMQKGPEYFIEAARIVLSQSKDVHFVMAGSGDMYTKLIELVAHYRIGDRFHFTGFLNKARLNDLLSIADVYCMPSVSEPFGLSAVEAIQYGIPTIISKTSGAGELLNGVPKLDFWDTHKIAEYMLAAIHDPIFRKRIIGESDLDLNNISWQHSAQEVLKVYHQLL